MLGLDLGLFSLLMNLWLGFGSMAAGAKKNLGCTNQNVTVIMQDCK